MVTVGQFWVQRRDYQITAYAARWQTWVCGCVWRGVGSSLHLESQPSERSWEIVFPHLKISSSYSWLLPCKVMAMWFHGTGSLCPTPQNAGSRVSKTKSPMLPGVQGHTNRGQVCVHSGDTPRPRRVPHSLFELSTLQWLSNGRIQEVRAAGQACEHGEPTSVRTGPEVGARLRGGPWGATEGVPGDGGTPGFAVLAVSCVHREPQFPYLQNEDRNLSSSHITGLLFP